MLLTQAITVHPEPFDSPFALRFSKGERFAQDGPIEGCVVTPFMLRQACPEPPFSFDKLRMNGGRRAQHERLSLQRPYNYGLISKCNL